MSEHSTDASTSGSEPLGGALATAGRWTLDVTQSSVTFASKTFWGLATVRGTFGTFSGEGEVQPDGTVVGRLEIQSASLDTKNPARDKHLRGNDFFRCEEHPAIVVSVREAKLADDGQIAVGGELTVGGTTHPLTFTAAPADATTDAVTLRAQVTIDKRTFGMTWNRMGMMKDPSTVTVVARFARA